MPAPTDPERPEPFAPTPAPAPAPAPAARERAVAMLTRRYAADELGEAELESLLDRVYRARTPAELEAVLAGLAAEQAAGGPSNAGAGVPAPAPREVGAFLSGQEVRITGVAPRHLRLHARLGYVELDLTHARFEPGTTEIEVHAFMGYVEIRLPAGVRVESEGHAFAGYFSVRGGRGGAEAEDVPVVRLTGRATLGYAECYVARGGGRPPAAALPGG